MLLGEDSAAVSEAQPSAAVTCMQPSSFKQCTFRSGGAASGRFAVAAHHEALVRLQACHFSPAGGPHLFYAPYTLYGHSCYGFRFYSDVTRTVALAPPLATESCPVTSQPLSEVPHGRFLSTVAARALAEQVRAMHAAHLCSSWKLLDMHATTTVHGTRARCKHEHVVPCTVAVARMQALKSPDTVEQTPEALLVADSAQAGAGFRSSGDERHSPRRRWPLWPAIALCLACLLSCAVLVRLLHRMFVRGYTRDRMHDGMRDTSAGRSDVQVCCVL
jgi:hypothetical protein